MPTSSTFETGQNYYTVLGLSKPSTSATSIAKDDLRAAYHRALLLHHPDKLSSSPLRTSDKPMHDVNGQQRYTIDQIVRAYQVLLDPQLRKEYDLELQNDTESRYQNANINSHLGVESFDLDDLEYHEQSNSWTKSCRCGTNQGYIVTEHDLEKSSQDGEVYVGCNGCSLVIKIIFSVVSNEE